jgi:hypothetical protein
VKRCGKSAPRSWQHERQAKPLTEQDQIGWRYRTARPKPPGRSLDPASDRGARGMIVPPERRKARGRGGKSELQRAVRRVTPGQGNLTDSGTENIPPARVRVKRCGKSAPRPWQHGWQAKPRTEQGQIGWRYRTARPKPPGRSLDPASNRGARGMIVAPSRRKAGRREESPSSAGQCAG